MQRNRKIVLKANQKSKSPAGGSEGSPFFETEPIDQKLKKVHYLVTTKDWEIKPACRYIRISESTYNRYRQKLEQDNAFVG